jgi:hypothetical protein
MANINKTSTRKDANQVIKNAFNDVDDSLTTSGFLTSKVGNKIERAVSTTSIANDTETYTFYDGSTALYSIKIVYTDGDKTDMLYAERIS